MEARIGQLESDVDCIKRDVTELRGDVRTLREHQERDFRLLFGALIVVALGLAALMAKGFGWFH
jgi:hypothetical protein